MYIVDAFSIAFDNLFKTSDTRLFFLFCSSNARPGATVKRSIINKRVPCQKPKRDN